MTRSAAMDAIGALLGPLLGALDRVGWVQRYLYPPVAPALAERIAPCADAVSAPLEALGALAPPDDMRFIHERLVAVGRQTVELIRGFLDAAASPDHVIGLFRALRPFARVQEALYPLAPVLDPVSRWFLDPERRSDDALVGRLREAALRDDGRLVGVLHSRNDRAERGGVSVYVPETWDGRSAMPLVMALHGGSGHGRDFLWTWMHAARSRGVMLLAPSSRDRTWSIMGGDDVDAAPLCQMVEAIASRYAVDRTRVLLAGMSDGATYALLCGLRPGMPFTHLAPASGVLHPLLLAEGGLERARGRPIYLVHGGRDWMFPVHTARMMRDALAAAGARLVYRELDDLSHTYARDEHPRILDWLIDGRAPTPQEAVG